MAFELLDVDFDKDGDEFNSYLWISHEHPYQRFFCLFCPIQGEGPEARTVAIRQSAQRRLAQAKSDPHIVWQKAVNEDNKIVGGALWKIYDKNPFEGANGPTAFWYPEGEARDYASECLRQFEEMRAKIARRPQLFLNIVFTHPDYRRQGVADLMLSWDTRVADERGLEMWSDATELGRPKHGFIVVHETHVRPVPKGSVGHAWEMMESELQPIVTWQMWKPVGGNYKEGETVKPWE